MSFKSPYPDVDIPNVDLPTYMFSYPKQNKIYGKDSGAVVMIQDAKEMTFNEFESKTLAFASGLYHKLGFQKGDILAVVLMNDSHYPVITNAALMLGGIVTTGNPGYTPRELGHQFELTKPKVVVAFNAVLPIVNEALHISGLHVPKTHILTIDGTQNTVQQILLEQPFPRVYLTTEEKTKNTPAFIVFSSGTSGTPKGVVLSHRNMVANTLQFSVIDRSDKKLIDRVQNKDRRRWLHVLPMFHIYGILILNVSILSGSLVVIMNKFSFPGFCQLIQDYKIDTTYVAPPIILALAKSPETKKYNLSHLVYINSAAAPLSSELQVETEQKLGVFVTQGYGMSEAGPLVSRSSSGSIYSGSVGPVCSNTEIMFLDKNNIPVGVNQVGELCVKGPQIMIGYYKNKEATDEAIQSDGYLHTGDMGYIDSAGNIYITDRKKELIKYKGFQIPPAELEGLLTEHPAVVDAAVIPIYDDTRVSEIPKAFVVLQPCITASDVVQDICNWLSERVADYKRLRGGIEVIDAIPRSATGKILRRVLKDLESERRKQHTLI